MENIGKLIEKPNSMSQAVRQRGLEKGSRAFSVLMSSSHWLAIDQLDL